MKYGVRKIITIFVSHVYKDFQIQTLINRLLKNIIFNKNPNFKSIVIWKKTK